MIVETGLDGLGPTPGEKDLILATTLSGVGPISLKVSDQDPNSTDPAGFTVNDYNPVLRSEVTPSTVGSTLTDSTVSQEKG